MDTFSPFAIQFRFRCVCKVFPYLLCRCVARIKLIYVPEHRIRIDRKIVRRTIQSVGLELKFKLQYVLPKITSDPKKRSLQSHSLTLAGDTFTSHSNPRLIFAFACAPTEQTQFSFRSSPSASTAQSVGSSRHEPARNTQHLRRGWTLPCR
jgi:hypothetical protein